MKYTFNYRNYTVEVSTDKHNWYMQFTDADGLINRFQVEYPHTIKQPDLDNPDALATRIIRVYYEYLIKRPSNGQVLQSESRFYNEPNFDNFYDAILPGTLSYGNFAAIHALNGTLSRVPELGGNTEATGYRVFNADGSFYQPVVFDIINLKHESLADDGTGNLVGQKDASFDVAVINGTPTYEYSLDGVTYQAGSSFLNLAAGEHNVHVRDAAGVVRFETLTIGQVEPQVV